MRMEIISRVIGKKIRNMEREQCFGLIQMRNTQETGRIMCKMALELMFGWNMVQRSACLTDILANGSKAAGKVWESFSTPTGRSTQDIGPKIKNKEPLFLSINLGKAQFCNLRMIDRFNWLSTTRMNCKQYKKTFKVSFTKKNLEFRSNRNYLNHNRKKMFFLKFWLIIVCIKFLIRKSKVLEPNIYY